MTCDVFSRDMCGEIALVKNIESKIMEELFNFLSEWAGWIFGFFATAFAVRGSIRFDVNVWLNDRLKQREDNLNAMCPHVRPVVEDGTTKMQPTITPPKRSIFARSTPKVSLASNPASDEAIEITLIGINGYISIYQSFVNVTKISVLSGIEYCY